MDKALAPTCCLRPACTATYDYNPGEKIGVRRRGYSLFRSVAAVGQNTEAASRHREFSNFPSSVLDDVVA